MRNATAAGFGKSITAVLATIMFFLLIGNVALAQNEKTYTLGVTFPLTGIAASQGESATKAVDLAVQLINEEGYIRDGGTIEARFYDSQAKPDVGVRALQQAITVNNVPYVLTGYSSVSAAQAPVAERNERVLVNVGGASPALSGLSPWYFNALPLTHLQVPVLIDYIAQNTNYTRYALLFRDDDLGRGIRSVFAPAVESMGGQVVGEESFLPGTNDFRRQLTRLRSTNPEVIYIGGVATEIGAIISQAASLGLRPMWTSYGAYNHASTVELGGEAAEGGLYTNTSSFDANLKPVPEYSAFRDAWVAKYGSESGMDYVASQFYLGTYLYADTINTLLAKGKDVTPVNIRDALREGHFSTVAGELFFNENQDAITSIAIYTLEDGKFHPLTVVSPEEVEEAVNAVTR